MNKATLSSLLFVGLVWAVGCGGTGGSSTGGDGGGGSNGGGGSDGGATTGSTSSSTGDGGSTTSDTTSSTTSDTTSSTSSVTLTGTDPQAICDALCAVGKQAGCYPDDPSSCVAGCVETYQTHPMCTAQLDAAFKCAIEKVPSGGCSVDALCPAEGQAAEQCMNADGCGVSTCSGSPDTCGCETTCNGVTTSNECTQTQSGISCTCFVDGAQVGVCTDSNLECNLGTGCCSQFF